MGDFFTDRKHSDLDAKVDFSLLKERRLKYLAAA